MKITYRSKKSHKIFTTYIKHLRKCHLQLLANYALQCRISTMKFNFKWQRKHFHFMIGLNIWINFATLYWWLNSKDSFPIKMTQISHKGIWIVLAINTIKDTCRPVCPFWWTQSASWDSLGSLNYSYILFPQPPPPHPQLQHASPPKPCRWHSSSEDLLPSGYRSALSEAKRPQSAWDYICCPSGRSWDKFSSNYS